MWVSHNVLVALADKVAEMFTVKCVGELKGHFLLKINYLDGSFEICSQKWFVLFDQEVNVLVYCPL